MERPSHDPYDPRHGGRVLEYARWELLHTLSPVKEIAREFERAVRGGGNLSMSSAGPSIPQTPAAGQNADTPACEARKSGE